MNFLKGKNILVISPEAWGKSKLSKHHYALTLAAIGNKVWFLQPPNALAYKVETIRPMG
jgi:energy-coupling factor transporter ATP-binding protein EcfA2